jgi:hypothetical protein
MQAVKRLTIAICCVLFCRCASSSVKVEKIVPHECTQVLRIAVTLNGKPLSGAVISVRAGFFPEEDPPSFISTRDDGMASVPKLAPGNYRVDVSFSGIRSAIFDEPVATVFYVHAVPTLDVSTVPIDLGKPAQDIWRSDGAFDRQLKEIDWHGRDRIQSFRATIMDPVGAKVPFAKVWAVRMTRHASWEVVSLGASDGSGQFSAQLRDGQYVAICSLTEFRTAIVPFEVAKDGSGELRIALQIAPAAQ